MKPGRSFGGSLSVVLISALVLSGQSAVAQRPGDRSTSGRISKTKPYVGSVGYYSGATTVCDRHYGADTNFGQVCFERTPGRTVQITIEDESGRPVAGWAVFIGRDGNWVGDGTKICGKPLTLSAPPGWQYLDVYLAGPVEAAFCAPNQASGATKGIVRATFTDAGTGSTSRANDASTTTLRRGMILGGLGFLPPQECRGAPDCLAWLQSDCNPRFAGLGPAWLTSIVDVADLADGTKNRWFDLEPGQPVGNVAGGAVIQFWRADCSEIGSRPPTTTGETRFVIPIGVQWMTVTASDNRHVFWTMH